MPPFWPYTYALSPFQTATLKRYARYYSMDVRPGVAPRHLAAQVGHHFQRKMRVADEDTVLANFTRYIRGDFDDDEGPAGGYGNGAGAGAGYGKVGKKRKRKRDLPVLGVGVKVAAKIGTVWMLASVLRHNAAKRTYKVEDADAEMAGNPSKYTVSEEQVLPLPDLEAGLATRVHRKGARVLALFPGTTSFYPATVAKKPAGIAAASSYTGGLARFKYGLRFDGDEKDEYTSLERLRNVSADLVIGHP